MRMARMGACIGNGASEAGCQNLVKAWKINKRLHIISYGDNKIYDYDDEYDEYDD